MPGGYGGGPFGGIPYGGSLYTTPGTTFNLSLAVAIDTETVEIYFSTALNVSDPTMIDTSSYTISGAYGILTISSATIIDSYSMRLKTSTHVGGATYTVTVVAPVFQDALGADIDTRTASFVGAYAFISGYGSGGYGVVPYGGSGIPVGSTFDLSYAVPPNNKTVDLIFSMDLNAFDPTVTDVSSYTISGACGVLLVTSAYVIDTNVVRLKTSKHIEGCTYIVTVVAPVFRSSTGDDINVRTASFTGLGAADAYIVSNLVAKSWCTGKRIELSWTNPAACSRIKILRRTRSWPFDMFDDYDTVYDSTAVISSYSDLGATTTDSAKLLEENTYYYYVVLASPQPVPSPWDYDITDDSRTFALSIEVFDSKNDFLWKNTPSVVKAMDAATLAESGGEGFLDKWYTVMGCWLNLMRGYAKGIRLNGDDDKAPYHILAAKNYSFGTSPEGESYDFATSRRQLLSEAYIYKRRGTCPGMVEAIRMFTLWDAMCAEVGLGTGCHAGSSSLTTWDGNSSSQRRSGTSATLTFTVIDVDGRVKVEDSTASWDVGLWTDGKLIGPLGDVSCIESSGADYVITKPPRVLRATTSAVGTATTTISVSTTLGLQPGMTIQITGRSSSTGLGAVDIVEVYQILSSTSFSIVGSITTNYQNYPNICIGKSTFRPIYQVSVTPVPGSPNIVVVDTGGFVENQWAGMKISLDDGIHDIASNNEDTIVMGDNYAGAGAPQTCTVANNLAPGLWTADYRVMNGSHTLLFDPMFDFEARGTAYDMYSRLWAGSGLAIMGAWRPTDVVMYVLSEVAESYGPATVMIGSALALDSDAPPPAVNEWVGMYLNPNQNQNQLFEIVSNTTSTVTVDGDISSLVVPGQYYYILTERNRNRFVRVSERLNQEFGNQDIQTHVLFV